MRAAIYTEKTQCRDCYKCVRHCPVKAIRVAESSATIDHDLCIFCGRCVEVCPAGAKKVRNDIPRAQQLIKLKREVYVSLAPSFPAAFPEETASFLEDLKQLGFAGVSETALGAEAVSKAQRGLLDQGRGLQISSACPSIRILASRYFPEANKAISPLPSPMVSHARLLRRWYGEDIGIVFIGPCIAKKTEAEQYPELIDLALTFDEALQWIEAEKPGLKSSSSTDIDFVPHKAGTAALFPLDGGMIRAMGTEVGNHYRCMNQSGCREIVKTYENIDDLTEQNLFLELMACDGGCINGPGFTRHDSGISRQVRVLESWESNCAAQTLTENAAALVEQSWRLNMPPRNRYTAEEIEATLRVLGKERVEDRKDCGGCGYNTCREFAVAFLDDKAEKEMCVTEMRRLAQNKVSALLHTIPMGAVIVDAEMRLVECNRRFLELFADLPYPPDARAVARAEGNRITAFVPETDAFHQLLERDGSVERIVKYGEKVLKGLFFQIQAGRLVGAVFQDITAPAVKRETVVKKAEEVIRKNLESVQQIAGLLGENAAETEIILNSLISAYEPGE